jgi:hypothetical protein
MRREIKRDEQKTDANFRLRKKTVKKAEIKDNPSEISNQTSEI